ncbi:MAG: aldehyde ferredoxin oxidoreductase C-terminal domain-containing protein, partial [Candidatus Korarchaeota archaeon]|nr:aldehyde ferredoxin oxidoreductase C-terminal domain-containing protein [Candidatus Korarchaeota archaeon]
FYRLVTGVDVGEDGLREAAKRIIDLSRWFNVREGVNRGHDRLPRRLVDEPLALDGAERRITEEEVEKSLDLYYRLRGWDGQGVPTRPPED